VTKCSLQTYWTDSGKRGSSGKTVASIGSATENGSQTVQMAGGPADAIKNPCKILKTAPFFRRYIGLENAPDLSAWCKKRVPGMTRLSSKLRVARTVLTLVISLSLSGCVGPLKQQARTVRVTPVSEEYELTERLRGKTYVLLAEASTGQEQYRSAVSDSLARVIQEYGNNSGSFLNSGLEHEPDDKNAHHTSLEVLSFTDFVNTLNKQGISQRHSETRDFYRKNGMFKKSDLQFLRKMVGADYFVLPCLLNVKRWDNSRFSVLGVKLVNTHVTCAVVSMEIWDARTGYRVFSATSDVTVAGERIREDPIAIEEVFERAWFAIIEQLPT